MTLNYPRDEDRANAEAGVDEIRATGGRAVAVKADVSRVSEIARLHDEAEQAHGRLDLAVANTGGNVRHATFEDTSEELWEGCC